MAAFIFTGPLLRALVEPGCRPSGPASENILPDGLRDDAGSGRGDVANDSARVWRVYTIEDGTTRMEPIGIPLEPSRNGTVSKLLAGSGAIIRHIAAGITPTWHAAPRRQFVVTLAGAGEIGTGDGQRQASGAGVLFLLDDVTGVGHMTWTHPTDGWLVMFVPLDAETTLV
jgi:hypothetical protein